ncbi:MAG: DegT/DnrJ/EryC1/StrS family aminotransferase, partial [Opitutales bacterium]
PDTSAIIPVHLYGHPADVDPLRTLADRHGLFLLEDAAQAHGARYRGRPCGGLGDAAAFSFYPTKNLGALGDGGAVASQDPALLEQVRWLRQYGWRRRYVSEITGRNSRLDELQAAILRVFLPHLDAANAHRATLAARYLERLRSAPLILPVEAAGRTHVWHQFVVRTPQRDALQAHLEASGIISGILYPVPIHRQPATYRAELTLPVTERACAEVLSLPLHGGLHPADVDTVCDAVLAWRP